MGLDSTPLRTPGQPRFEEGPSFSRYGESTPLSGSRGGAAGQQSRGGHNAAQPPPIQSLFDTMVSPHSGGAKGQTNIYADENLNPTPFKGKQGLGESSGSRSGTPGFGFSNELQTQQQSSPYGGGGFASTPKQEAGIGSVNTIPSSPNQIDPFYTQGEALQCEMDVDRRWVTVFGFPPSSAAVILKQFLQYGDISQHVMAPQGGNWMHIQYQSEVQAQKALSKMEM